jgi:hypothetical protein
MPSAMQALEQLRASINLDIEERTIKHQAKIAEIKASALAPRKRPLALLAHGDSWFNYPLRDNGPLLEYTDIIVHLSKLGNPQPIIHNISHFGDTATVEMSLPKQQRLIESLTDPKNWLTGKPDAILFSGGGNDIVGDPFCLFLNDINSNKPGLADDRLAKALDLLDVCYGRLFAFRDKYARNVPIFGHCYDFPIPNNAAPICAGPWLQPSLVFCGWTKMEDKKAIVNQALIEFKKRLDALALDPNNNFFVIKTQTTLKPDEWANELHPKHRGFAKLAKLFADALKIRFRGRI